jgi:branched-chain amino acid transport system substrate-binding protein
MRRDDLLHDVQRRRTVALIGATSALAALPRFARAQAQPIKVGVVLPLSGANMPFGVNSRNGIELVADQINASGRIKALGRTQIDLVVADATSAPTVAAGAAERLIAQDGCVALIGAFASALTIAVSEVTERHGIPLLTMSFSDQITGRGFKNVFQVVSKGSAIGKAQFDYAIQIAAAAGDKIERAAIMYEDTAYGTSQAAGLRGAAKAANVQLVMDDAYSLGITDVAPMIDKLRNSSAQVVFPVSYLGDSLLIIRTMRQRSIDLPVIGGAAGYVIPEFVKGLAEFSDNVFSISPVNHDLAPEFTDGFRKRYGYFMVHEAIEPCRLHGSARAGDGSGQIGQAARHTQRARCDAVHRALGKGDDRRRRQVRPVRPQCQRDAGDGAMAEGRAGHGLAARPGQGEAGLARQSRLTWPRSDAERSDAPWHWQRRALWHLRIGDQQVDQSVVPAITETRRCSKFRPSCQLQELIGVPSTGSVKCGEDHLSGSGQSRTLGTGPCLATGEPSSDSPVEPAAQAACPSTRYQVDATFVPPCLDDLVEAVAVIADQPSYLKDSETRAR